MNNEKPVYFELNNWCLGRDYPNSEPFISWMGNMIPIFEYEEWVTENGLCVVASAIDMSLNYCITATEQWVNDNCPELLTKYASFLREPDEDGDIYGQFGNEFLPYSKENVGVHYVDIWGGEV